MKQTGISQLLVKFFIIDIHKKYFLIFYRILILLSQKFGLMALIVSLFKPLFGTPGIFSRIQGFTIRVLAILIGFSILFVGIFVGFTIYIGLIFSIIIGFYKSPILILCLLILAIVYKVYRFYIYPIRPINNPNNLSEYIDSGDYFQRKLIALFEQNKIEEALDIIFESNFAKDFFAKSEISADKFYDFLIAKTPQILDTHEFFNKLIEANKQLNFRHLKYEMFLMALLLMVDPDSRELSKFNTDIETMFDNARMVNFYYKHPFYVWDDEYHIPPSGGFDKDWAVGASSVLNSVSTDLTKLALKGFVDKLIGRDDVKENVITILRKPTKNNVLLLGNPGVGKTAFVNGLAREIATGIAIPELRYKRIVSLDLGAFTSGSTGDINKRLNSLIKEIVSAGNIILFVDEIHNLSSNMNPDPNASSVLSILEPYLSSGAFQFIATTSKSNYNKYILPNSTFTKNFDIVEMREATRYETLEIMMHVVKKLERQTGVLMTYPAYYKAFEYADRFVTNRGFPDKSVELVTRVLTEYHNAQDLKLITSEHVSTYVANIYKVPVDSLKANEKDKLLNLEHILHQRVIGQDVAIKNISDAIKRSRVGVRDENKPIASFLFAGPTGVGKTETAKALAALYFGSEDNMIRVDMSEYNDPMSTARLIGDQNTPGILTTAIRDKPYTLVLLDEIEKADRQVLNLFLQVLDDGRLTDSQGVTYDFNNSIIIMTSNVGTKDIISAIMSNKSPQDIQEVAIQGLKSHFTPEFLNRFTSLIPFSPLSPDALLKVAHIKLRGLAKKLDSKHIKIEFPDNVVSEIAKLGYSPEWGARPLNRVIEDRVETLIADKIIRSEIVTGDKIIFQLEWILQNEPIKSSDTSINPS